MAYESFFQDLIIDTPEAAAAFIRLYKEDKHFEMDPERIHMADERDVARLCEYISEHYSQKT